MSAPGPGLRGSRHQDRLPREPALLVGGVHIGQIDEWTSVGDVDGQLTGVDEGDKALERCRIVGQELPSSTDAARQRFLGRGGRTDEHPTVDDEVHKPRQLRWSDRGDVQHRVEGCVGEADGVPVQVEVTDDVVGALPVHTITAAIARRRRHVRPGEVGELDDETADRSPGTIDQHVLSFADPGQVVK